MLSAGTRWASEFQTFNQGVVGSIPTRLTSYKRTRLWVMSSRKLLYRPLDRSPSRALPARSIAGLGAAHVLTWCGIIGALSCRRCRDETAPGRCKTAIDQPWWLGGGPPIFKKGYGSPPPPNTLQKLCTFLSHPPDVRDSMVRQLRRRGFLRARQFCTRYPLELIMEAMADVAAMVDDGIAVRNPAGLIRWRVEKCYYEV